MGTESHSKAGASGSKYSLKASKATSAANRQCRAARRLPIALQMRLVSERLGEDSFAQP